MKNLDLSIILPTFNERKNIGLLIDEIIKNTKKVCNNFEIIVVDDNSPDKTSQLIRSKYKNSSYVKLFIRKNDKGLATAIKTGIKKAKGQYILVMDTDFNHDPRKIPNFLKQGKKYGLIIGSRYVKNGGMENKLRFYLSYLFNVFIRLILNHKVNDSLSGFFLMKQKDLLRFDQDKIFYGFGEYFIRLTYLAKKYGISIKEIPVYYINRPFGKSKSKFVSMFITYTLVSLKLAKDR